MPDLYLGPSTLDAGDMAQMAYGYYNPAQDHLMRVSQTPSPPAVHTVTGYPGLHPHAIDMPEAPQDYFLPSVAPGSDQSLAGFGTYPTSQSSPTDVQTPWPGPGW